MMREAECIKIRIDIIYLNYFHLLEHNDDVDSLIAASTQPELEDHTSETDGSLYDDSEHNNK